jgi:hypothetical protein
MARLAAVPEARPRRIAGRIRDMAVIAAPKALGRWRMPPARVD